MTRGVDITQVIAANLARRHAAERRFRLYGMAAIGFAALMLLLLLASILGPGISGFIRHEVRIDVDTAWLTSAEASADAGAPDFYALTRQAIIASTDDTIDTPALRHQLLTLVGTFAAFDVKAALEGHAPGTASRQSIWVPLASNADLLFKGVIDRHLPMAERPINDQQLHWLDQWQAEGRIRAGFNWDFFTRGDSRAPEAAGFLGSMVGSLLVLAVCMSFALPVAVMAAITLEEFARKTRLAEWLEIIINNLAAVPSIIYGLLGLSIFLQLFEAPRSSALVGGLTITMLILPVMIIAARSSIRAVPPSMRQAATALGATQLQVVRHHVLPYALPGIMTGTILAVCRTLGETAPLLMIGMVAFVADIPRGVTDPATAMPVEIYLWASSPELGFIEKTSSGIIVLLVLLLLLNGARAFTENMELMTQPATSTIAARDVSVFYGSKQALYDVSLDIADKSVTAFIGPSGCGKSTFLRCLNRMNDLIPGCRVTGSITLDGDDIYDPARDVVLLRARVGMVFQKPNPFPKSIYENVAYGARINGLARHKTDLDAIVERSLRGAALWDEVKDRLDQPGTGLSGGQQQRLCIARTMAVSPEIILMDEPCSALDPIATSKVEELIEALSEHYTIVIVTHSMAQARRVSKTTAFFHMGNVVEMGATEQMFEEPVQAQTRDYISGRYG